MPDIQTIPATEKTTVLIEPIAVRSSTATQMLGISRPKLYEIAGREDFHGNFKVDGCLLFSVEYLREWVRRQCGEGSAE